MANRTHTHDACERIYSKKKSRAKLALRNSFRVLRFFITSVGDPHPVEIQKKNAQAQASAAATDDDRHNFRIHKILRFDVTPVVFVQSMLLLYHFTFSLWIYLPHVWCERSRSPACVVWRILIFCWVLFFTSQFPMSLHTRVVVLLSIRFFRYSFLSLLYCYCPVDIVFASWIQYVFPLKYVIRRISGKHVSPIDTRIQCEMRRSFGVLCCVNEMSDSERIWCRYTEEIELNRPRNVMKCIGKYIYCYSTMCYCVDDVVFNNTIRKVIQVKMHKLSGVWSVDLIFYFF